MPDAKRKERAAARRAAQVAEAEAWQAKVDRHFAYLRTTYDFRITSADASSFWVTRVVYQSDVAAVAVDRSVEFERVELSVIRLVDGRLPEYPIFILPDTVINQTLFDNILTIRSPHLVGQLDEFRGLDDEHIETSLAFLGRTLEEIAPDFLTGDLSIFEAVDALIKERVKAHPPIITVHLPESATAEQEAAAIEAARNGSPGVQVVARRYRRPVSPKRKNPANNADTAQ
ncbi:MAG TPA: hypothetical protein VGR57_03320 [Ktedonobacterales bacterium]|nr:hypothetical protein [Ktedonobacterales bacterium]